MKNNRNRHLVISKNCSDRLSFPHSLPERSVCQTWIIQYKRSVRPFRNQGPIAFRKFTATNNFRKTSHSFLPNDKIVIEKIDKIVIDKIVIDKIVIDKIDKIVINKIDKIVIEKNDKIVIDKIDKIVIDKIDKIVIDKIVIMTKITCSRPFPRVDPGHDLPTRPGVL